ncbi:MAG: hypothetical protein M3457_10750 [Chloroflexota bacterium]|nr:hypothetical protein [Chloroflexota bacterium]
MLVSLSRTVLTALPIVVWVLLAGAGVPGAGAQPETGDCVLEPLTLPLFDATPAAHIAATPLVPVSDVDTGDEAILAAVEDLVDCINTGDAAYQYAIFTQRYLGEQFANPSVAYQPAFELQLSQGPAEVEETFELVGVSDIAVDNDGLVTVTIELSGGGVTYRDTLVLANVDRVWLIDSIEELDPPQ